MGEISTKANEVYRDRDGSSPHYPEKPAIRSLFQLVDASVADVGAIIQAAQEADGDAAVAGAIAGQAAGEEVAQEIANGKADVDLGNATFEWDGSGRGRLDPLQQVDAGSGPDRFHRPEPVCRHSQLRPDRVRNQFSGSGQLRRRLG